MFEYMYIYVFVWWRYENNGCLSLFEILVFGGNSLFNTLSFFINDSGIMLCVASLFPFTIVHKITLHKLP